MKYSTATLPLLVCFLPSFVAGQRKPSHRCSATGASPSLVLGGYDVRIDTYGRFASQNQQERFERKRINAHATAMRMVNDLWRKELIPGHNATIQAAVDFHPDTLAGLTGDEYFGFEKQTVSDFDVFRGVGVKSGIEGTDNEISEDEGIYVTFGGLAVDEVFLGIRALFVETQPDLTETGLVTLYKDGQKLAEDATRILMAQVGGATDGKEFFVIKSDTGDFDAMSFVTMSHSLFQGETDHDFYLEYIDLCYIAPPSPAPTPSPTPSPTQAPVPAFVSGDPHIKTWSGTLFDFHGVCDLVLLQNPDFETDLGLDIHVRTKQLKQFSYVSSAAVRIGEEILEVTGDEDKENLYWLNKQGYKTADHGIIGFVSGYPVSYEDVNSNQHKFTIRLGKDQAITVTTFKKIVRVDIVGATKETFGSSLGLLGSYGSGDMVARDKSTILEDANAFGQEWQVLEFQQMLFHDVEGPQAPEKCFIPMASSLRRRLVESKISEDEAKAACARVNREDFDICVFDVMATGDEDVAGAY